MGRGVRRVSRRRGDARRRLGRQIKLELVHQKLLFDVQFRVAAQDQCAAVGGRKVDIEHLDGGELVEHGPGREAGRERLEAGPQGDMQTIGDEGDEDVRFDALFALVIDRAQLQVVLKILERGLDLDQLDIEPPQLGGLGRIDWCARDSGLRAFAPRAACCD